MWSADSLDASGVKQVWHAGACGKLNVLCKLWNCLCELGPSFGYFLNAAKTWVSHKKICLFQDFVSFFDMFAIGVTCLILGLP